MDERSSPDPSDSSIPPPPGVDVEEHKRHQSYESSSRSRSSSRDYERSDRDRSSRHERSRESRHDRDDYSSRNSYSNEHRSDRSYHEGDRDYRDSRYERSRGYRDRSRDRDRDRTRDRSRGDRERDRERDRDKPRDRDYRVDEIPHSTILVKGMGPLVTEDDIRNEITRYSLYPKEVILMRRKNTGESRGFAFVEFQMLSDAVRWKELTQGVLYFGDVSASLHYFVPKDIPERNAVKVDWTCIKCGVNNFRKRDMCFKCNAPRDEAELTNIGGEGCDEVSHSASSTLLFRNLDILTTEERVLSMLGQITVLPIKNLKVAKDSLTHTSRGFAYVELHSISEAMQLHDLLVSMAGNFYVDGRRVTVSYSRRSLSSMNSAASANAASVALAAAQWTNQDASYDATSNMFSDTVIRERQEAAQSYATTDTAQKYSTPDVSTYQYDKASGYYYDASTGYYYDPNSQYYYNSQTRQYLYWDGEKQTYLAVPTSQPTAASAVIEAPATKVEQKTEVVISSPPVISHAPVLSIKKEPELDKSKEKSNVKDKVKFAKRVAKDMEKWAKTLNQKKENAKNCVVTPSYHEELLLKNEAPAPEKKLIDIIFETPQIMSKNSDEIRLPTPGPSKEKSTGLVAAYGDESDSEVEVESQDEGTKALDLLRNEESKLIDWTKLACLLCKRQFPSKDVLTKHIQLSDLHKQNVHMLKLTKLSSKQLQELEKRESGYRDRAKERREKFGQPDIPPPSKLKTKYLKERGREAFVPPEEPAEAIGSDNIGNKMLKAMGWTEGQGLGKSGQGMSGIIEVQRRVKSAGLGMKGASYGANASDSYKDAVRKAMQARYNEIA